MSLYASRDSNIRRTWIIVVLFLTIVIAIGWAFSYIYNDRTILYIAIAFSLMMNVIAYWNSDKIVLKMSGAQRVKKEEFRELYNIVENLCISIGIPMPAVYVINDQSANAFATGRNPKHSAIAVTVGLMNRLDRSELEAVVAHELAHIKNYDILLATIVVVLVGFVAILSDIFMRSLWFRGRGDNRQHPAMLIAGIVLAILAPIAATLIQLAISRKREFLADSTGALMTRYPDALASALRKISSDTPLKTAKTSTAHLFFVSPFKADVRGNKKTPWFAKLFMTHPPIEDRIKALMKK